MGYYLSFTLLFLLFQNSCFAKNNVVPEGVSPTASSLQEIITTAIENGITNFTVNLNKLLQTNDKNLLFSPLNIYVALALVNIGSKGETRNEICRVMGISKAYKKGKINTAMKALLSSAQDFPVKTVYENDQYKRMKITDVNLANGIFVEKGLPLNVNFTNDAKSYYNSSVIDVDFSHNGNEATDVINRYVANKTENLIPELFSEPLSSDVRILLITSLYFKSIWDSSFSSRSTKQEVFHLSNGQNSMVQMMRQFVETPYFSIPSKLKAVNLWFADKITSMYFVLPDENITLNDLQRTLTTDDINQIIEKTTENHYVDLQLPKVSFKWSKKIDDQLSVLGIKKLFTDDANLESMVDTSLKVSEINHATSIKITEEGTEASAVTTVQIAFRSGFHSKEEVFHANKPFLFFIYHHGVKSILFFGSVYNPNDN